MAWRRARRSVQGVAANWTVARGTDNSTGRPVVIRINTAYADASNRQTFPFRIEGAVQLVDPRPDGMPGEDELGSLADTEDRLVEMLAREAVPVMIITGNGRRDFLFYSRVRTELRSDGTTKRVPGCSSP